MKKKTLLRFCVMVLCAIAVVLCLPNAEGSVFGATTTETVKDEQIADEVLVQKLKKITNKQTLNTEVLNSSADKYVNLNLSSSGATGSQIKDISGLALFKLSYTTTLNLTNNAITEIPKEVFDAMPNLNTLIVSNNQLQSLDLTGCYKLKVVDASGNMLESFNGFDLENGFNVNLSKNNFSEMSQIVLPDAISGATGTIELYNNNITDFTKINAYDFRLGVQGVAFNKTENEELRVEKSQKLVYFKTTAPHRVKVVVSKKNGETWQNVFEVKQWEETRERVEFNYTVGKYRVEYYYVDNDLTEYSISTYRHEETNEAEEYYNTVKSLLNYYNGLFAEYSVVPSTPTYSIKVKDVTYKEGELDKLKSKGTLYLTGDEGAQMYYRIGSNGEWISGNEVTLDRGGTYFIEVKAVVDGFESSTKLILINANPSLTLPSILLLILILVGAGVFFGVGYPLIRKYVINR